jgi:hypothetical protein
VDFVTGNLQLYRPSNISTKLGRTLVQLGFGSKPEPVFEDNEIYDDKCPSYVKEALVPVA